mmetsp:Transcript_34856/g.82244  ORF Transcript_34856/g.82244 Transcript_34856/m.82244 type:complete len:177 (-) Transcript_34856:686-1216(-)
MSANRSNELIELLEKIVLQSGSELSENKTHLLTLTAIKAMDYINRLNNYDMSDIANIAVGSELYEEALVIFKKAELHREAAKVLIDYISSIERATEFAERIDEEEVWVMLGKAQLQQQLVKEAMQSSRLANTPRSPLRLPWRTTCLRDQGMSLPRGTTARTTCARISSRRPWSTTA